jgi:inosose dehydratase
MDVGYTTIMHDADELEKGISDIAACRYDGVEIGLGKVREAGVERVAALLAEYDLDLFCVMSEWLESDAAVERVVTAAPTIADLGAEFFGLLPPQRGAHDDETVAQWVAEATDAAAKAGLTPVVHHHGGTEIEGPKEIRQCLDRAPTELQLLFDTAHYYPYGDPIRGINDFAEDIAYVHLKDINPSSSFQSHTAALTTGSFHLDDVINYFRAFTDLPDGEIDFGAVAQALRSIEYVGHVTVEIENKRDPRLLHAKRNLDHWRTVTNT